MSIWTVIANYFSPLEKWGNPEKLSGFMLLALNQIRIQTGWRIIIHCAYEKRKTGGYHPKGEAVDFHFDIDNKQILFSEQILVLLRILENLQLAKFCGLGIYPDWNNPGFHFDSRGLKSRWGRVNGIYVKWDEILNYVKRMERK